MDHSCYLCLVFVMLSRLFIATLRSPEGKELTSWLLFVMFCDFVTFPFGILGQVWYLIVSIPDPCCLSYILTNAMRQHMKHTMMKIALSFPDIGFFKCKRAKLSQHNQAFVQSCCGQLKPMRERLCWQAYNNMICRVLACSRTSGSIF